MTTDSEVTTARDRLREAIRADDPHAFLYTDEMIDAVIDEARATLLRERDELRADLEHMARWRHDQAHNGDIYHGGDFPCDLCPKSLSKSEEQERG